MTAASARLRLAGVAAVLAGDVPASLAAAPGVERVEMRDARRAVSPAASYAVGAVRALDAAAGAELGVDLDRAAVFTFAGPPGSALRLFQAGQDPANGRLVSPGFGQERSRRIHPFALLLALQNQVAATLSLELGLHGPCCSTTDSAGAFADLVPNMALAARSRPVLAVLASAADRDEHRSRGIFETGTERVVEGAVALLFSANGTLGRLGLDAGDAPASDGDSWSSLPGWYEPGTAGSGARFAPVLEPGLSLLAALARGDDRQRIAVREPRRFTAFTWSRA